jgi:hypothetical protein
MSYVPILVGIAVVMIALFLFITTLLFFALPWLAEEDILFTTVKEGTAKAIMRGRSFDHFIMSFEGFHLNDPRKSWYQSDQPDWEVILHPYEEDSAYDDRSWLLKHLGLYWVGWPWANRVYIYGFEWNETTTDRAGKDAVLPRREATDFIYVADFTYAIVTSGAETKDRLQTDELTLATVAIRNPYRALFSGEDWMRRVTAAINRRVREFVSGKAWDGLLLSKDATDFSRPIIELTEKLPDDVATGAVKGLHGRYGVEIRTADLQTIDLSGESKRLHEEATTREYAAEQEAKAERTLGQARADVIKMIGDKEAEALQARLAVIKANGNEGIILAGYDSIVETSRNPGSKIIWANNPLSELLPRKD